MGSGAPSTTESTSSRLSRASSAMTHWPSGSMPRRPARPAIWVSSFVDSARKPRSVRLVSPCRTTLRAGMWIPRLIVSVAKTTRTRPRSNSTSVRRLRLGRIPAWWSPTPDPEGLEDGLVERGRRERRALVDRLGDGLLDLAAAVPVEKCAAFLEDLVHRALAPGPAEDEVDRRQPAARLQLLEHRRDRGHAPGVEAPPPLVAAALDPDELGAARPHGVERSGSRPPGRRRGTGAAPGRCGWTIAWIGRWTSPIQSAISRTFATVADSATRVTSFGALTMISSQTVPRLSSPM